MNKMGKKIIYIILYIIVLFAFVYFGTRDYDSEKIVNDQEKFSTDYPNVKTDNRFEYFNSTELINFLNNGNGILFLGDKESDWSKKYAEIIYDIAKINDIEKVYYYDVRKVKLLQNSNYYDIIKALDGYLVETDSSKNNLLTPSLYIIKDGKVVFHDTTTSAMNNEISVEDYWNSKTIENFIEKISLSIKEYC